MKKESLLKILPFLAILGSAVGVGTPLYFNSIYPNNGYWLFSVFSAVLCLFGLVFGYFGFVSGASLDKKFFKFMNKLGVNLPKITDKQVEDSRIYIKIRGYLISTYGGILMAGLILLLVSKQTNYSTYLVLAIIAMIVGTLFAMLFLYYDYKMLKDRLPQLAFWQYIIFFAPIG